MQKLYLVKSYYCDRIVDINRELKENPLAKIVSISAFGCDEKYGAYIVVEFPDGINEID